MAIRRKLMLGLLVVASFLIVGCSKPNSAQCNLEEQDVMYLMYKQDSFDVFKFGYIFKFYNCAGELVNTQKFELASDISYSTFDYNNNILYAYGPGGLFKISLNEMKVEKIDIENRTVVDLFILDDGRIIYVDNVGFSSEGTSYSNRVYFLGENDALINTNYLISSIAVWDNEIYLTSTPVMEGEKRVIERYSLSGEKITHPISYTMSHDMIVFRIINNQLYFQADNGLYDPVNNKSIWYNRMEITPYHYAYIGDRVKTFSFDVFTDRCVFTIGKEFSYYDGCEGYQQIGDTKLLVSIGNDLFELDIETEKMIKTPIEVKELFRYHTIKYIQNHNS